jgi:hypothetical protein
MESCYDKGPCIVKACFSSSVLSTYSDGKKGACLEGLADVDDCISIVIRGMLVGALQTEDRGTESWAGQVLSDPRIMSHDS